MLNGNNGIEIPEHSSGSEWHFFSLKQWTMKDKTKESIKNKIEQQKNKKSNNEQNKWTTMTNTKHK